MNRNRIVISLALSAFMFGSLYAVPNTASASGSYFIVRVPVRKSVAPVDSEKYQLGKAVFYGRITLGSVVKSKVHEQRGRLEDLNEKLPEDEAESAELDSLAGKLTDEQLSALEAYVTARFKKKD